MNKPNFILYHYYTIVDQKNEGVTPTVTYSKMAYKGRVHGYGMYFYTFRNSDESLAVSEDSFHRYSITPEDSATPATGIIRPICVNCKHWRDKAWTDKGWGRCDNEKNEVHISGIETMLGLFGSQNEWIINEIKDGIRYPEDFGCTFFEAPEGS